MSILILVHPSLEAVVGLAGYRLGLATRSLFFILASVFDKRLPKTNFQQTHPETVDVVLHPVSINRVVALPQRVPVDVPVPAHIAGHDGPCPGGAEGIEPDKEDMAA